MSNTLLNRRQILVSSALGFSSVSLLRSALGQEAMADAIPAKLRSSLRQTVDFNVPPEKVYKALLTSSQFAKFSGMAAQIDPHEGGAFTMFGGLIKGRNIELVPNKRVVQAWRPGSWDQGAYSVVKFDLTETPTGTKVTLDHTGFPEGDFDSLSEGWHMHYWDRLKIFFAG